MRIMALIQLLLIAVGLAIVIFSADEAIKRLLNLARFFRLPEFVTSLVLAGTIAVLPELSIGVAAALGGTSSLGFGVILGSNIADLTLVIGVVAASAGRLNLNPRTLGHIRASSLVAFLPILLFIDGEVSRTDGGALILAYAVYLAILLRSRRDEPEATGRRGRLGLALEATILVASLTILFVGGSLIASSSQELSLLFGLPLVVIGAIVAVGTCIPEMSFAIRASRKRHGELGLGNVLGNVLADSMLTIGIIALIQPIRPQQPMPALFAAGFMAVSALIVYGLSRDGNIDRRDGAALIIVYCAFLALQSAIGALNIEGAD